MNWINVKDGLPDPDENGTVLAFDGKEVISCYTWVCNGGDKHFNNNDNGDNKVFKCFMPIDEDNCRINFTHLMPLPEAPNNSRVES